MTIARQLAQPDPGPGCAGEQVRPVVAATSRCVVTIARQLVQGDPGPGAPVDEAGRVVAATR